MSRKLREKLYWRNGDPFKDGWIFGNGAEVCALLCVFSRWFLARLIATGGEGSARSTGNAKGVSWGCEHRRVGAEAGGA